MVVIFVTNAGGSTGGSTGGSQLGSFNGSKSWLSFECGTKIV